MLTEPQSWNRYTYAANNPLRFTDPDGKHNAEGHNTVTNLALEGSMSSEALGQVSEGNLAVDAQAGSMTTNDAASTNQHGLAGKKADGTWQTPGEAAEGAAKFVDTKVTSAAEKALDGDMPGARRDMGAATHTVQDSTAGGHNKQQRWNGAKTIFSPKGALHGLNDMVLTVGEGRDGVAATRAVHGRVEGAIRDLGQARGLTDAAIADAVKAFNGR